MKKFLSQKTQKEKLLAHWTELVHTYNELKKSPRVRLILKIIVYFLKILFGVLIRKLLEYLFEQ